MANYTQLETRRAEVVEAVRRGTIAIQLFGDAGRHNPERAVWLFCPYCARRKLTDAAWFSKHLREAETVADMVERMPCLGCGRVGLLKLIPAPARIADMANFLKQWDIRDLVLTDRG